MVKQDFHNIKVKNLEQNLGIIKRSWRVLKNYGGSDVSNLKQKMEYSKAEKNLTAVDKPSSDYM